MTLRRLLKCSTLALALAPVSAFAAGSLVYVTNSAGDNLNVIDVTYAFLCCSPNVADIMRINVHDSGACSIRYNCIRARNNQIHLYRGAVCWAFALHGHEAIHND